MSDPDVDLRPGRAGYWVGGLLLPFAGIKVIDLAVTALHLA